VLQWHIIIIVISSVLFLIKIYNLYMRDIERSSNVCSVQKMWKLQQVCRSVVFELPYLCTQLLHLQNAKWHS